MSYFKHHVFFCCNQRAEGETCCANHDAVALQTTPRTASGPSASTAGGRSASTRPAAWAAATTARCWSFTPKPGTPSSTGTTSTRSSPSTCRKRQPRRRTPEDLTMATTETATHQRPRRQDRADHRRPRAGARHRAGVPPHPLFPRRSNTNKVAHTWPAGLPATSATRRCGPTSAAWAGEGSHDHGVAENRRHAGGDQLAQSRWGGMPWRWAASPAATCRPASPRGWPTASPRPGASCWSAPPPAGERRAQLPDPAGARPQPGDPTARRTNRAPRQRARLGRTPGAAGDRRNRRRPFLPRPPCT